MGAPKARRACTAFAASNGAALSRHQRTGASALLANVGRIMTHRSNMTRPGHRMHKRHPLQATPQHGSRLVQGVRFGVPSVILHAFVDPLQSRREAYSQHALHTVTEPLQEESRSNSPVRSFNTLTTSFCWHVGVKVRGIFRGLFHRTKLARLDSDDGMETNEARSSGGHHDESN